MSRKHLCDRIFSEAGAACGPIATQVLLVVIKNTSEEGGFSAESKDFRYLRKQNVGLFILILCTSCDIHPVLVAS